MRTARFRHSIGDGKVQCDLCPHHCKLQEDQTGICKARGVRDHELKALTYGLISSAQVDPIEKKPLYHFHPGSSIFSVGSWGCNFSCVFCQNWTISQQATPAGESYSPQEVAARSDTAGSIGIAYTYNEPLVSFEFVFDCARLVRERGLANVLVTNGYVEEEPAAELLPLVDALNIDIKSMDDSFYRSKCGGRLEPVLQFSIQALKAGCHVEITNLLIPDLNDSDDQIKRLAGWMKDNLGATTPLHLSAYHPQYKLSVPPTPPETLERARRICREELTYVYIGNLMTAEGQNTFCPGCKAALVKRRGYRTTPGAIRDASCATCGRPVDIVITGSNQP